MDEQKKTRIITLTDRPPVRIVEDEWPVVVSATGDSYRGNDCARHQQALSQGECDEYWLMVRQHQDGRSIVYARLDAAIAAWHQPAGGENWRGGALLPAGGNLAAVLRRVGEAAGLPVSLIRDAIAGLPPENI